MRHLAVSILALIVPMLSAAGESSLGGPVDSDHVLLWESSAASSKGIRNEVGNLYQTLLELHRGGQTQILTRPARLKTESAKDLRQLVEEEGLYDDGGDFPEALDLLLCELNPQRCDITMARHQKQVGHWYRLRGVDIQVPDLRLEGVDTIRAYDKKRGDSLSRIVVNDRKGCKSLDQKCRAVLKHLNGDESKLEQSYEGVILVPSQTFRAALPLPAPAVREIINGGIDDKLRVRRPTAEKFLDNVIATPQEARFRAGDAGAASGSLNRVTLEKLIRYSQQSAIAGHSLAIGLMDSMPDVWHCDFDLKPLVDANKISVIPIGKGASGQLPPQPTQRGVCGQKSNLALTAADHGTHLLGIWLAKVGAKSGDGMLPVSGVSSLSLVGLDIQKLQQSAYYAEAGDALTRMIAVSTVINMSWGVNARLALADPISRAAPGVLKPRRDPIATAMARPMEQRANSPVMFVVAAGNDGTRMESGACDITPACPPHRAHVLSVAALNNAEKDPDIAPSSNYGWDVDIGVPAVDLVSTFPQDRIAAASGTSQAAAVASAAASMLMYTTGLWPRNARARLIYTSDLTPTLQRDNKLFGGRMNFHRAVHAKTPWVAIKGAPEREGSVKFGATSRQFVLKINSDKFDISADPIEIDSQDVRRIHRNPGAGPGREWTIFYREPNSGDLKRVDGSLPQEIEMSKVTVTYTDRSTAVITLRELNDFTAAIPDNY